MKLLPKTLNHFSSSLLNQVSLDSSEVSKFAGLRHSKYLEPFEHPVLEPKIAKRSGVLFEFTHFFYKVHVLEKPSERNCLQALLLPCLDNTKDFV